MSYACLANTFSLFNFHLVPFFYPLCRIFLGLLLIALRISPYPFWRFFSLLVGFALPVLLSFSQFSPFKIYFFGMVCWFLWLFLVKPTGARKKPFYSSKCYVELFNRLFVPFSHKIGIRVCFVFEKDVKRIFLRIRQKPTKKLVKLNSKGRLIFSHS